MGFAVLSSPPAQADYALFAPEGRLLLRVVATIRRSTNATWAIDWRADHHLAGVPVLLATPEHLFGWRADAPVEQAPDLTLNAVPLLSPYLTAIATGARLDPQVFEWVVGSWLQDVLAGDPQPIELEHLGDWLRSFPRGATLVHTA